MRTWNKADILAILGILATIVTFMVGWWYPPSPLPEDSVIYENFAEDSHGISIRRTWFRNNSRERGISDFEATWDVNLKCDGFKLGYNSDFPGCTISCNSPRNNVILKASNNFPAFGTVTAIVEFALPFLP